MGYRNYADDVAKLFVDKTCEAGMDVFRVFDALNDFRNFQTVVERIKANGKHFQGTICYSLTERRMGGEVFNLDYYISKAKEIQEMGADTLCLKDMAGIMAPFDIAKIILVRLLSRAGGGFEGSFTLDSTAGRKKRESTPA